MEKCFCSLFLLMAVSVTGVVVKTDIYETGSEDKAAVIQCPYNKYYKTYYKYFCKGQYKNCQILIKTDDKEQWVIKGRLSLHDNKEINMFVVTFSNLSLGDTGYYGCGIEITGQDQFTLIHLTVMKAEKPHLSSSMTTTTTTTTTTTNTTTTTISTLTTQEMNRSTSADMRKSENITENTGNSTQPTVSDSLSGPDVLMYAGGAFCAVLLVFLITFCVFGYRELKDRGGANIPNTQDNMKEVCVYEEIQLSSPAEENASETPDLTSSPYPYRECKTVYSTITNHQQDPHHSVSSPSSPVSCGPDMHRNKTEDHQEPKYSHLEFPDAGDHLMKYNDIYSTAVNNPNPIYSSIIAPKN